MSEPTDPTPPPGGKTASQLTVDVRRLVDDALVDAGVSSADPEVRRLVIEAITNRPLDRRLSAAEKRHYALELRIAGASYREIARLVGYSGPGPAQKTVMKALEALNREPAEQLRSLAVERLEGLLAGGLYRKAKGGDLAAVDRVITVMRETRRYIPGLEVPANAEVTGAGGGSIIVELSLPDPVPVTPIPEGELAGLPVIDLPASAVVEGDG